MKKIILISFIVIGTITANHEQDLVQELGAIDYTKWPQFLTDFYLSAYSALSELKQNLLTLPSSVYEKIIPHHPYENSIAHVRYSPDDQIPAEEKQYIDNRLGIIKQNLEKMFNIPLSEKKLPKIALCLSGGGCRAMILSLGFLLGAQEIGLFDVSSYIASLSGSTWAVAPSIASGKNLSDIKPIIKRTMCQGINHIEETQELKQLISVLMAKLISNQAISAVDLYGSLLANTFLTDLIQNPIIMTLTEAHKTIKQGNYPFPIYTSIETNTKPYEWMEITPFELGSSYLKAYIPTWAYGRKFKHGISIDASPEQTLGYFMGIFGSAFEASFDDIIKMTATQIAEKKQDLPEMLQKALSKCLKLILSTSLAEARLFPSILSNFTYQLHDSPLKEDKTLCLVDAGLDFNLPFPPLLRQARDIDIIIVYDASASVEGACELVNAANYAQRKGLKFPTIKYNDADKNLIQVFKDPQDPSTPVVIYIPRIKNDSYSSTFDPEHCIEFDVCNTYNFTYNQQQFEQLYGLAYFTTKQQASVIHNTIKEVLEKKYGYTIQQTL